MASVPAGRRQIQDRMPSSEFIPGGIPVECPVEHPFGPRLGRAVLLLTAAVAMHVGFVRAPHVGGPGPIAAAGTRDQAGLAGVPSFAPTTSAIGTRSSSVRVRTEVIDVGVAGTSRASDLEVPVATTGIVQAGSAARARARSQTPTNVARELGRPSASLIAPTARPLTTIQTDEPQSASVESGRPAAQPTMVSFASREEGAAPNPAGARSVVPAADRSAELEKDEQTVRRVLLDYTQAFERLDVQAAKAIWPSVDDRALQRAFHQLDGQQLRFATCGVSVSGHDANARCRGEATYRPKVGSRVLRLTEREWTFNLSRDNDRWQIVKATLQ